jgi:glycosyltransferase involved in cell wall biosynthesis
MKTMHFATYPVDNPEHGGQIRAAAMQGILRKSGHECIHFSVYIAGSYQKSATDKWSFVIDLPPRDFPRHLFIATTLNCSDFILRDKWMLGKLEQQIRNEIPDVLIVEQPWLWPLVKHLRKTISPLADIPVVYSSQNYEVDLFEEVLRLTGGLSDDEIDDYIFQVKELEGDLLQSASLTIAVTQGDKEKFQKYTDSPIVIFKNGIHPPVTPVNLPYWQNRYKNHHIAFSVSSAHLPNAVGVVDLLTPCGYLAPNQRIIIGGGVCALIPQLDKYRIFRGINNSRFEFLWNLASEDLSALLKIASVLVLPITKGGGSNLKTAEALFAKKPILATSVAMRGYENFLGNPLVHVEDDPKQFRNKLAYLLNQDIATDSSELDFPDVSSVLWENRLEGLPDTLANLLS